MAIHCNRVRRLMTESYFKVRTYHWKCSTDGGHTASHHDFFYALQWFSNLVEWGKCTYMNVIFNDHLAAEVFWDNEKHSLEVHIADDNISK
jgi:hypothetical protein